MTAKTRAKPSLHRDSFVAPLARGTRTLPGACVGLRLLKHTAGPLGSIAAYIIFNGLTAQITLKGGKHLLSLRRVSLRAIT